MKRIRQYAAVSALVLMVPLAALAWSGPTAAPPGGNVAAPINTGPADQTRDGWLGLTNSFNGNALSIIGNAIMSGSNRYLNFGITWGSSGYGIRDNAGTLEFKNSGGGWASIQNIIYNLIGPSLTVHRAQGSKDVYNNSGVVAGRTLTFEKSVDYTDLYIRYSDTHGIWGPTSYPLTGDTPWCAWDVLIDGTKCSPSVRGTSYVYDSTDMPSGGTSGFMLPSVIEGYCSNVSAGSHTVTVAVSSANANYCYSGFKNSLWSITIQEVQ
jgi:hypothetical protein